MYQPYGMQTTLHNTWDMKLLDTLTEEWIESTIRWRTPLNYFLLLTQMEKAWRNWQRA